MATQFVNGRFQAFDDNGDPLVGGLLYTYTAGTTTNKTTYSDPGLTTPNTNPVVLDARGEADVWWGTGTIRMTLKTSAGVTVWDKDNIPTAAQAVGTSYIQTLLDDTTAAEARATLGAAADAFVQTGTGAATRTVDAKLKERVSAEDFFAAAEATATQMVQRAIDAVYAAGGGVVELTGTNYTLGASTLSETYDNFGAAVPASDGCIVMRPGVYLRGRGVEVTKLLPNSPGLTAIIVISPTHGGISDLTIDASWSSTGAGHGIFGLNVAAATDEYFRNYTFRNLYIKNVGSYGIGVQNGDVENVTLENIRTYNTGADGIDFKNRGPTPIGQGISAKHIYVENFGQRLDGCAGFDIRGRCNASHIYVTDVGRTGVTQTGIRMRGLSSASDPAATYSTLDQYQVIGNGAGTVNGVEVASPNTKVGAGFAISCTEGFLLSGNSDGHSDYAAVVGATAVSCTTYGFRATTGVDNAKFVGCAAVSCTTGFRNEATNTLFVGCDAPASTTEISTSGGASPTEIIQACRFGSNSYKVYSNSGRITIEAMGSDTNIDLALNPKGSGYVRFGTHTASGDAAVSGYISVRDSAGNIRKLAVIT